MTYEEQLAKAAALADDYHTNHTKTGRPQKYGDGKPYSFHLNHVGEVLTAFGFTPDTELGQNLHIGAKLHDTVEDTTLNLHQIEGIFGKTVATFVDCVSNGEGPNRASRHAAVVTKINNFHKAIILKMGDRIANVVQSCADVVHGKQKGIKVDHKLGMYLKEWKSFEDHFGAIARAEAPEMWTYLSKLMTDKEFGMQEGAKRLAQLAQS